MESSGGAVFLVALLGPLAGIPGSDWYARRGRFVRSILGFVAGFLLGIVVVNGGYMLFGSPRPSSSGGDEMAVFFIIAPMVGLATAVIGALALGLRRA